MATSTSSDLTTNKLFQKSLTQKYPKCKIFYSKYQIILSMPNHRKCQITINPKYQIYLVVRIYIFLL